MKENGNPDVCPCCGQKIPAEPKHYSFWEQWAKLYEMQLKQILNLPKKYLCHFDLARLYNSETVPYYADNRHLVNIPKPQILIEWEKQNPIPETKIDHIGFTVQLAQRVKRLESLFKKRNRNSIEKWEYKEISLTPLGKEVPRSRWIFKEKPLSRYGDEGWEAYQVEHYIDEAGNPIDKFYLKRPL